jgi:hypothetical protein
VGLGEADGLEAAVSLRLLLLDDVRLDGHAQVVRLTRQIGGRVIVRPVMLERAVAEVRPQHGHQAQLVRHGERFRNLLELPHGVVRPEVDGGSDGDGAHVEGLLHRGELDLIELVRVGQKLVVVELDQERDLVGVLAGARAQHPERGGDAVAATFDRQLDDVLRVEVGRVRGKAGPGRVLDPLVHR